ncbi:MAG: hypothetical protein ACF8Q5_04035 [Phycisphaerales bacterium JB040]
MSAHTNDTAGPLSTEMITQLVAARDQAEPVRRAARFVGFYSRLMVIGAAIIALFAFNQSDTPGMILAGLMVALAVHQMKMAGSLRSMNPAAVKGLVVSHALVAFAFVGYAAWDQFSPGVAPLVSKAHAATASNLPFEVPAGMTKYIGTATFVLAAVGLQTLAILYINAQKRTIGSFSTHSAPWVNDLFRRGVMG